MLENAFWLISVLIISSEGQTFQLMLILLRGFNSVAWGASFFFVVSAAFLRLWQIFGFGLLLSVTALSFLSSKGIWLHCFLGQLCFLWLLFSFFRLFSLIGAFFANDLVLVFFGLSAALWLCPFNTNYQQVFLTVVSSNTTIEQTIPLLLYFVREEHHLQPFSYNLFS